MGDCLSCDRRPNTKRTTSAEPRRPTPATPCDPERSHAIGRARPWIMFAPILGSRRECSSRRPGCWFNHYEVPDNQDMYFVARSLPGLALVASRIRLGLSARRPRLDRELAAPRRSADRGNSWRCTRCSVILFFVLARFRQPLMPFWVVFAALGGRWLLHAAEQREFRRVAMATAGRGGLRSRGGAGSPISRPRREPGACLAQPGCAAGARRSLRGRTGVGGSRRPAARPITWTS